MENLPKKVRSKKLSNRVDLTAMVSVSFLLIIFFMVTIELAKPKVMEYGRPDCDDCESWSNVSCYSGEFNYTILLDDDNKIVSYMGFLQAPIVIPRKMSYGKDGIHQELHLRNESMLKYSAEVGKPGKGLTVIIKPSKNSNYGNLVDILDEMKITGIKSYSILDEFTPEETRLLASM